MTRTSRPSDALAELVLHCESKQRRLEAMARRLSGYASLRRAPEFFREEAKYYKYFGNLLRRVGTKRSRELPRETDGERPLAEKGTDLSIEKSFHDVMKMRLPERERREIQAGYRTLVRNVRNLRRATDARWSGRPPREAREQSKV